MTAAAPQPAPFHPRSARAARRTGARLTSIDPQSAPRTYGPSGVSADPRAARGIILYIGLDEAKAAAEGTNPPSDLNGDADYRRHLATVLTRRAVLAAAGV